MAYIRCSGNIGGSLKVRTASGNPCTFETNLADKLVSLKAAILASGGGGTPATPIPIVGYSSLNLTHCGVNLFNEIFETGSYDNTTGEKVVSAISTARNVTPLVVDNSTEYYFVYGNAFIGESYSIGLYEYDASGAFLGATFKYTANFSFTTRANTRFVNFRIYDSGITSLSQFSNTAFNYPSSVTTYEPYNGTPYLVQFGQTVYGGVLDVTRGKLHVTHGKYLLDGNTSRNDLGLTLLSNITQISYVPFISEGKGVSVFLSNIFQDSTNQGLYKIWNNRNSPQPVPRMFLGLPNTVTTIEQAIAWFASNPTEVIYELATPIEIDVSALSVDTIVGVNNVFHDGNGDTEVKYLYKA